MPDANVNNARPDNNKCANKTNDDCCPPARTHRFSQQEILNAINRSKTRQADMIVTTQKDAVRFPKIDRRDLPIFFMRVEIRILKGAKDFQDCVRQICFR